MFNLFRRDNEIYAPLSGLCQDIIACKDKAFASKALGDGILIYPSENIVKSPCNGKIVSIFPTKHAIGIITNDRKEILLHIGIDTVKLEGKGFNTFVTIGDKVKKGDLLIKFNQDYMEDPQIDMSILIILLNGNKFNYKKRGLDSVIKSGEKVIEFESGD